MLNVVLCCFLFCFVFLCVQKRKIHNDVTQERHGNKEEGWKGKKDTAHIIFVGMWVVERSAWRRIVVTI